MSLTVLTVKWSTYLKRLKPMTDDQFSGWPIAIGWQNSSTKIGHCLYDTWPIKLADFMGCMHALKAAVVAYNTVVKQTVHWCHSQELGSFAVMLKIKCNVFLFVEVNFSPSVFNINKSIWVLRKITKITNLLKKRFKVPHRRSVYISQLMTSYRENKEDDDQLT